MRLQHTRYLAAGVLITAAMLAGCKTTPTAVEEDKHIVYPEPPAPPRFQFVTSFSSGELGGKNKDTSFAQWVVGEDKDPAAQTSTAFENPYGIAVYNARAYICDVAFAKVHIVDLATRRYDTLKSERIRHPVNITIDTDGTKYLCDNKTRKVLVFDAQDRLTAEIGNETEWMPVDVAIRGNELFVTDATGGEIEVWSKQGQQLRKFGEKGIGPDQLQSPTNLDFGTDGKLYVVDTFQQIVKIFDPDTGAFLNTIGAPGNTLGSFARPKGISIAPDGTVYVSDAQWEVVQVFQPNGQLLLVMGEPGKNPWSMGMPAGLCIDKSSIEAFRSLYAKNFEPDYLLFVVNQFGKHKIGVWAYGRDTSLPASAYEINQEAVERRRAELRGKNKEKSAEEIPPAVN